MQNEFIVEGMSCMGCVRSIEAVLREEDPNAKVVIDLNQKKVRVEGKISAERVAELIEEAGYTVVNN